MKWKIVLGVFAIVVVSMSVFFFVGLQERPANAAEIDPTVLNLQGWAQAGVVEKTSMDVDFVTKLKINIAMLTYADTRVIKQINDEKNRIVDSYKTQYPSLAGGISIPDMSMRQGPVLATVRIMPPMIADFFKGQVVKMATDNLVTQYVNMATQSGIQNFKKTGETQLTVKGKSVTASLYEGSITADLAGNKIPVKVKGIFAVWADTGIVVVMGTTLAGSISYEYKVGPMALPFSYNFETSGAGGGSEFNEVVKLVESTS